MRSDSFKLGKHLEALISRLTLGVDGGVFKVTPGRGHSICLSARFWVLPMDAYSRGTSTLKKFVAAFIPGCFYPSSASDVDVGRKQTCLSIWFLYWL